MSYRSIPATSLCRESAPHLPQALIPKRKRTQTLGRKAQIDGRNKATAESRQSRQNCQQQIEAATTPTRRTSRHPGRSANTAGIKIKVNGGRKLHQAKSHGGQR
jgi:hypothetical protein